MPNIFLPRADLVVALVVFGHLSSRLVAASQKKGEDQWYEQVTDVVSARIQYNSVAEMDRGFELLLWHSNPAKV